MARSSNVVERAGLTVAFLAGAIAGFISMLPTSAQVQPDSPVNPGSAALGAFAVPANYPDDPRPTGEIGPGECWPRDERPRGGTKTGFAQQNGPELAAQWLRDHPDEAQRLERHYSDNRDYYLIDEVVPNWSGLPRTERAAIYVANLEYVELPADMLVLNTYCDDEVIEWETQVLPKGEPVFFIPGHGPGSDDVRPAHKAVCGNPLLPPKPEPSPSPSPSPSPPPSPTPSPPPPPTGGPTCPPGSDLPACIPPKEAAPQPPGVEKPGRPNDPQPQPEPPPSHDDEVDPPLQPQPPAPNSPSPRPSPPPPEDPGDPGEEGYCPPGVPSC